MVFTTYLFVFYFLPLVLLVYYGLLGLGAALDLRLNHVGQALA